MSIVSFFDRFPERIPDKQIASCGSRVNKYPRKDKQRIAAQSRGQRLKLLQRWTWNVLRSAHKESFEGGIDIVIQKTISFETLAKGWIHNFIDLERKQGSQTNKDWVKRIETIIRGIQNKDLITFDAKNFELKHEWEDWIFSDIETDSAFPVLPEFQRKYLSGNIPFEAELKSTQHAQLVQEACSFLWTMQNQDLLTSIFMIGLWEVIDYVDQQPSFTPPGLTVERESDRLFIRFPMPFDLVKRKTSLVSNESKRQAIKDWSWIYQTCELWVLYLVATIPWGSELQRLESESKEQRNTD